MGYRTLLPLALAAMLAGCSSSIDPTEQALPISFFNDLDRTVAVKLCADDDCHRFDYTDTVRTNEADRES